MSSLDEESHQPNTYTGNMHTDFHQAPAYREEGSSSGFADRDIQARTSYEERSSNRLVESKSSNHWARQSKSGGVNIDDMPIPTVGERPKTFEELLEEKLEAQAFLNEGKEEEQNEAGVPKKQFLKRKTPSYKPPTNTGAKQYRYYSDAIAAKENDGEPQT